MGILRPDLQVVPRVRMFVSLDSELSSYLSAATNSHLHLPAYQRAESDGRKNWDMRPLSC